MISRARIHEHARRPNTVAGTIIRTAVASRADAHAPVAIGCHSLRTEQPGTGSVDAIETILPIICGVIVVLIRIRRADVRDGNTQGADRERALRGIQPDLIKDFIRSEVERPDPSTGVGLSEDGVVEGPQRAPARDLLRFLRAGRDVAALVWRDVSLEVAALKRCALLERSEDSGRGSVVHKDPIRACSWRRTAIDRDAVVRSLSHEARQISLDGARMS